MKWNGPKQDQTSTKDLIIELPELQESFYLFIFIYIIICIEIILIRCAVFMHSGQIIIRFHDYKVP